MQISHDVPQAILIVLNVAARKDRVFFPGLDKTISSFLIFG